MILLSALKKDLEITACNGDGEIIESSGILTIEFLIAPHPRTEKPINVVFFIPYMVSMPKNKNDEKFKKIVESALAPSKAEYYEKEIKELMKENERLRKEITELKKMKKELKELSQENLRLKREVLFIGKEWKRIENQYLQEEPTTGKLKKYNMPSDFEMWRIKDFNLHDDRINCTLTYKDKSGWRDKWEIPLSLYEVLYEEYYGRKFKLEKVGIKKKKKKGKKVENIRDLENILSNEGYKGVIDQIMKGVWDILVDKRQSWIKFRDLVTFCKNICGREKVRQALRLFEKYKLVGRDKRRRGYYKVTYEF